MQAGRRRHRHCEGAPRLKQSRARRGFGRQDHIVQGHARAAFQLFPLGSPGFPLAPRAQTRDPSSSSRLQTPDSRLPTPDSRLQTPDSRLQTPDSGLIPPIAFQHPLRYHSPMPRRVTVILPDTPSGDVAGPPCLGPPLKGAVRGSEPGDVLSLVPKFYLGTRLSAKLRFARSAARGMVRGNRRKCKAQLCPQARSQVKLGNEGETPVIAAGEAKQSPARQRPGVRNIPRPRRRGHPPEGGTRTARALCAVPSTGAPRQTTRLAQAPQRSTNPMRRQVNGDCWAVEKPLSGHLPAPASPYAAMRISGALGIFQHPRCPYLSRFILARTTNGGRRDE